MYPESIKYSKETRETWGFRDHCYRDGSLEPSFTILDWEKIEGKDGVTLTPYQEIYRRPEPESDVEKRLENIEDTLNKILETIQCMTEH